MEESLFEMKEFTLKGYIWVKYEDFGEVHQRRRKAQRKRKRLIKMKRVKKKGISKLKKKNFHNKEEFPKVNNKPNSLIAKSVKDVNKQFSKENSRMGNIYEKILNLPNIAACVEVWSVDSRIYFFLVGSGRQFNKGTQLCNIVLESSPSASRTFLSPPQTSLLLLCSQSPPWSPASNNHEFASWPHGCLLLISGIIQNVVLCVWFLSCEWALPCCLSQSSGGLDCSLVSCSLDSLLFLYPSSTGRALDLFLGHIVPRISKCARNRRSDSSLGKAVCGLGSPDSASECEVAWKTNWQLAMKLKTHVQPHAMVHLRTDTSCSVLLKDTQRWVWMFKKNGRI